MGAWIETRYVQTRTEQMESHPSWVRGLKLQFQSFIRITSVAPLVGAWIETLLDDTSTSVGKVAPLVGAWIETR